ncbi:MAG: sulfite exporter TauE/SafE family protein [Candidatus Magnetominusculus sp. LBB02]|nr:sulfite exporter TauE/SafE family protein [Candidatus Magnetominusculus sp. LBB02]
MRPARVTALLMVIAAALLGGCAFTRPEAQHDMIQGFLGVVPVVLTGVFVGLIGTLVGAGGGFILVPILLIMYGFTPQHAIGTSTAVVFLNALSGTFSYMSQERIDYGLGVKFSVVAVPGVVIGAIVSQSFNMTVFSIIFALLLMAVTYTLVFVDEFTLVCAKAQSEPATRVVYDSSGQTHTYNPDLAVGYGGSFLVGILSGLLGVGGGLMHVPLMNFIGIPIHIAAATSHFIIVITSFFGVMIFAGMKTIDLDYTVFLGIGTILGAYYGARLAMSVNSDVIKKVIAVLLLIVSVKLIIGII